MKNIFKSLVAICICISFLACGNNNVNTTSTSDTNNTTSSSDAETIDSNEATISDSTNEADNTKFTFNSKDNHGNPVSFSDFSDSKLILVNMWEPWCGPCVAEMPDLEKLYQNYKDKGFLIIGLYDTLDMEEDTEKILSEANITYPIVAYDENIYRYATGYVPTSFFVSPEGDILSKEAIIGANSYEDWEALVLEYLE